MTGNADLDFARYLGTKVRAERTGYKFGIISRSNPRPVKFGIEADIQRMLMQRHFDHIVDKHQREAVEIPVL